MDAWLNLCKTAFVMLVLSISAVVFTRDSEMLVIGPIEHMVAMVKALADDPSGRTRIVTRKGREAYCSSPHGGTQWALVSWLGGVAATM